MSQVMTYSFSDNIVVEIAEHLKQHYIDPGQDMERLAVVFEGKRPSFFLGQELSGYIKKSFFPPKYFSIDEFINYSAAKEKNVASLSDLEACFIIYDLAKQFVPGMLEKRGSFARFLPWAKEVMVFIDHLDLEGIEEKALRTIEMSADIGYDIPPVINNLLANISKLRERYHEILENRNTFSRGMMYRFAAERIKEIEYDEFDRILFCNVLCYQKSEKQIIKHLYTEGKADLFFQGDQDEWPILKEIANEFSCNITTGKKAHQSPSLKLFSGFDVHSEACLVREIIKKEKCLDDTVIVLPEPHNIIPLLSEITPVAENFNVSMGYPIRRSALYALFDAIGKAQETKKHRTYYTRDYLKVLQHPFVKKMVFSSDAAVTRILVHKIEEVLTGKEKSVLSGVLFLRPDEVESSEDIYSLSLSTLEEAGIESNREELSGILGELHAVLFSIWEGDHTLQEFSFNVERLLDLLAGKRAFGDNPIDLKIVKNIFSVTEELRTPLLRDERFRNEDIFKIFKSTLENKKIKFSGSPVKGLQIMEVLETRCLGFENVIVMDVNEGVFPTVRVYEPLIPREVLLCLGITTAQKEEEIQRYHFMRLASHAKNVYLVFEETFRKEKSRFLEELIWEYEKKAKTLGVVPIEKAQLRVDVSRKKESIKKQDEVMQCLGDISYSATSLDTYIKCPLKFYYHYVLGLREKENLLDDTEGKDIGTFIHGQLEETYGRFLDKKPDIDKAFRKYFFDTLDKKFSDEVERKMRSDSFALKEILAYRLNRFLDEEEKRAKDTIDKIMFLERHFDCTINTADKMFKLQAKIDRVDSLKDGSILIIDYKTGAVDPMPKSTKNVHAASLSREIIKKDIKSVQLPLYTYIMQNQQLETIKGKEIKAGLYNIRTANLKSGNFFDIEEGSGIYLKAIEYILSEIVNPDVDFTADSSNERYCMHCPFTGMCM